MGGGVALLDELFEWWLVVEQGSAVIATRSGQIFEFES